MNASLVQRTSVCDEALAILSRLGTPESAFAREGLMVSSPITGELDSASHGSPNQSLSHIEPVSSTPKRKLEKSEQRLAPDSHRSRTESLEIAS